MTSASPRTLHSVIAAAALIVGFTAAGSLIRVADGAPLPVTLRVIQGSAQVKLQNLDVWQAALGEEMLLPGDAVRTTGGATAVLAYADGSTLTLGGATEVKVADSSRRRDQPLLCQVYPAPFCPPRDSTSYVTMVAQGSATVHVQGPHDPFRLFQVHTTYSLAEARGTVFEVEATKSGQAEWRTIEGQVSAGYLLQGADGTLAATATLVDSGRSLAVVPLPPQEASRTAELAGLVAAAREAVHRAATQEAPIDLARDGKALSFTSGNARQGAGTRSPSSPPPGASGVSQCLECHQELKAKFQGKSRHEPFVKGECGACHQALHSGKAEVRTPEGDIALCLSCHSQSALGISHPVGPQLVDAVTRGPLTCSSSCHDPHGSQYKALGRVGDKDKLCLSCHNMGARDR